MSEKLVPTEADREREIVRHTRALELLLADRCDQFADEPLHPSRTPTRREWATIAAALQCWAMSFEQARNEQDWEEWSTATGDSWEPLGKAEIEALAVRIKQELSAAAIRAGASA